jgi:hypothetical protein
VNSETEPSPGNAFQWSGTIQIIQAGEREARPDGKLQGELQNSNKISKYRNKNTTPSAAIQLHAPVISVPQKKLPRPMRQKAVWAPEPL